VPVAFGRGNSCHRHDRSGTPRLAAQPRARRTSDRADGDRQQHEPRRHGEYRRHRHDGDGYRVGNDRIGDNGPDLRDEHDVCYDEFAGYIGLARAELRDLRLARVARRDGGDACVHERSRKGLARIGAGRKGRRFVGLIAPGTAEPRAALARLPGR